MLHAERPGSPESDAPSTRRPGAGERRHNPTPIPAPCRAHHGNPPASNTSDRTFSCCWDRLVSSHCKRWAAGAGHAARGLRGGGYGATQRVTLLCQLYFDHAECPSYRVGAFQWVLLLNGRPLAYHDTCGSRDPGGALSGVGAPRDGPSMLRACSPCSTNRIIALCTRQRARTLHGLYIVLDELRVLVIDDLGVHFNIHAAVAPDPARSAS